MDSIHVPVAITRWTNMDRASFTVLLGIALGVLLIALKIYGVVN